MYADDTQLYASDRPSNIDSLVLTMSECINEVMKWMKINKLKMNEEKTEVILCNTKKDTIASGTIDSLRIGSEVITFSDKARNLGVYFDSALTLQPYINHLCKIMYLELRRIGQLSHFF